MIYKKLYLLYPVVFLLAIFSFDKLFLLDSVRNSFIQPGGMFHYGQRNLMLDDFIDFSQERRLADPDSEARPLIVVMGDSRSFAIGQDIAEISGIEADIFNFAGPQAVLAYHTYLLERMIEADAAPDAIVLGVSPDALNRNAGIMASPNMLFGMDRRFIEKYKTVIPDQDLERYKLGRRYALQGMNFSFQTLLRRIRGSLTGSSEDQIPAEYQPYLAAMDESDRAFLEGLLSASTENLSHYSMEHSPQRKLLDELRGAYYGWVGAMMPEELKEETEFLVDYYLARFVVSQEQIYFFQQFLKMAAENDVELLVYWPKVNPYLQDVYQSEPVLYSLWNYIAFLSRKQGAMTLDLNQEDVRCNEYYDASHLSVTCFVEITPFLLKKLSMIP